MSFLRALYELPHKVRSFLSPNNKKRSREEATENIEVESFPNSKRHATTRFVEEPPKQGLFTLQSHALLATNVNHNTTSITPVAIPKTSFTWGHFAPHSTYRHNNNNNKRRGAMQKKSLLAPMQVEEDAKGLEIYKAGVEAHRILEAQRHRAFELPPRAFPNDPAAATAGAINDGFKSQQAAAAKKSQQVDKFQEILSQYTSELRSTFNAKGVPSSLENLQHDFRDADTDGGGVREAKLASEKYSQRLEALKSRMEIAKKAAEESKISLQREKKTELELKEVSKKKKSVGAFSY
jgi:hypothetical protein